MSGSVRGYVMQAGNRPVAEASVVVAAGPGPTPDIAAVSDADGGFALDGLVAGTNLLRAFGPDGGSGEATVLVRAGCTATVTIILGGAAATNGAPG